MATPGGDIDNPDYSYIGTQPPESNIPPSDDDDYQSLFGDAQIDNVNAGSSMGDPGAGIDHIDADHDGGPNGMAIDEQDHEEQLRSEHQESIEETNDEFERSTMDGIEHGEEALAETTDFYQDEEPVEETLHRGLDIREAAMHDVEVDDQHLDEHSDVNNQESRFDQHQEYTQQTFQQTQEMASPTNEDRQMIEFMDHEHSSSDSSMGDTQGTAAQSIQEEPQHVAQSAETGHRFYAPNVEGVANPDVDAHDNDTRSQQPRDSSSLFVRDDSPQFTHPHDQGSASSFVREDAVSTYTPTGLHSSSVAARPIGAQQSLESVQTPLSSDQSRSSLVQRPSGLIRRPPGSAENPPGPTKSMYAKIRLMQRKALKTKAEASRKAFSPGVPRPRAELNHEDYLNSILTPTPASGGHRVAATPSYSEDSGDKKEVAEFRRLKDQYDQLKRKNGGSLTFRQDVEWARIQQAEDTRRTKQRRDQLKAQEEGLFLDNDVCLDTSVERQPDASGFDMAEREGSTRQRLKMPTKEPNRISLQDAEFRSMQVAVDAMKERPKKKRKDHPDSSVEEEPRFRGFKSKFNASKSTKSKNTKKGSPRGPRKTAKQKQEQQRALEQVTSLFTSDVFQDQPRSDAAEQPTFTDKRNRQVAMKELIASLPVEAQKQAGNDRSTLLSALKDFDGHGSVKPDGHGLWRVKGMATSLKNYQLLGTAFMRRRENAPVEPRGGLMADQMGLGKTLMMIANIVNGQPPKGEKIRTTLLVANSTLLTQWFEEIQAHTDCNLKIMRYRAGTRLLSNRNLEILAQHDIILTTYTEVMNSYPNNEPPVELQTPEEKIDWWKRVWQERRGVLHQMQFYRVVLDEAQAIKSHVSRTSIACRALMSDHRWALSGTPIVNGVFELYPYFKFLNVPHTGSFQIFKNNYCDNTVEGTERLLVRLSQFMIRRTHKDHMFGAPILKLPQADQAIHLCDFNPIERNIYDIVFQRFRTRINQLAKNKKLEGSYNNVLVMLLRLRQLTAHVLMLQLVMRDLLEREDIERIRALVKDHANDGENGGMIVALRKQLDQMEKDAKKSTSSDLEGQEDVPLDDDVQAEEGFGEELDILDEGENEGLGISVNSKRVGSGRTFGKGFDFQPYINSMTHGDHWEKVKQKARCTVCSKQPPVRPWITSCKHILCEDCYGDAIGQAAEESAGPPTAACKQCGEIFSYAHALEGEGGLQGQQYAAPETRSKAKGKTKTKSKPTLENEVIRDDWLLIGGGSVLPSAKTLAVKAQILNWIKENPKVKIIVYTQFLAMIRILQKACEEEHWGTVQYHGTMSFSTRDKAIRSFAADPNARILLASLRCGGLGLNLTMASRVILIDPWWNSAAEQQAFCRVYRIGQHEPTFMTRFCVRNTVDDRILALQERKRKEIEKVMDDKGKTASKLSLKDLMRLFGPVTEDEQGTPFIMVDNPDPVGSFRAHRDHEGYAADA